MGSERHAGEEAPPGDDTALVAAIVGAAERALAAAWGGAVRLRPAPGEEAVRERSTVLRCLVEDGPGDAPASVIVKCPRTRQAPPYDLADLERESPACPLLNE